ncbi:hypothetical protein CKAN_01375400 [Cinnamomum micranthum f. kanehirae]|uniref:Uncharacterized protein n=1 Tax=Cinnamomum micranthum f. kanehirae TaxID=337451 RepID=A0A3S3QH12_9MAGN|nr:hypothetical protein CKAN_01375400 [Cinnamomum micranthum f. kanehirae]
MAHEEWARPNVGRKLKIRSTKEWKGLNPKSEDKSKTPQSTLGKRKEQSDSEPDSAASLLMIAGFGQFLTRRQRRMSRYKPDVNLEADQGGEERVKSQTRCRLGR